MTPELKAQIEAALEPFAKLAEPLVDQRASVAIGLTDDDFRRAREALALIRSVKDEPSDGEITRLLSLLNERDNFIVGEGLWQKFCESLPPHKSLIAARKAREA